MRTTLWTILVVAGLALSACGTSTEPSGPSGPIENDEVTSYQALVTEVDDAASHYYDTMMSPDMNTVAHCQSALDEYDAQARPRIAQMLDQSPGLDGTMADHFAGSSDVTCMAAMMLDELDYHHAHACASDDLAVDSDEASRHVDVMRDLTDHMFNRCSELMNGLDDENWQMGPMMNGCTDWSAECLGNDYDQCCMGMMHCCDESTMHMGMMHNTCE